MLSLPRYTLACALANSLGIPVSDVYMWTDLRIASYSTLLLESFNSLEHRWLRGVAERNGVEVRS